MELGWILILAGIAILVFLHFSGRSRGNRSSLGQAASESTLQEDSLSQNPSHDRFTANPAADSAANPAADPYAAPITNTTAEGYQPAQQGMPHSVSPNSQAPQQSAPQATHPGVHHDHLNPSGGYDPHTAGYPVDYVNDPLMSAPAQGANENATSHASRAQQPPAGGVPGDATMGFDIEPGDMQRPADAGLQGSIPDHAEQPEYPAHAPVMSDSAQTRAQTQAPAHAELAPTRSATGFSSFLANLSGGILGKRRDATGSFDPLQTEGGMHPSKGAEPMVITLHVVAPEGQIIHGPRLQSLFEQRGYHYGEMNIFHSLNQGNIVFSVAKIVEPGTFDINNPASFETPGITLILQLPAPVAANVAFDVLVSEASEMAKALGCNLLDSGHSTLSRQTIQHLSDSVQQFMHRQRVAESVPS